MAVFKQHVCILLGSSELTIAETKLKGGNVEGSFRLYLNEILTSSLLRVNKIQKGLSKGVYAITVSICARNLYSLPTPVTLSNYREIKLRT